jgi:transcriptional regulator with XRE-family HTH domain
MVSKKTPVSEEYAELGKRLKRLRLSRELTQKEVAEAFGINPASLSEYESGLKRANLDTIRKFAEFYHVSGDELLGLSSTVQRTNQTKLEQRSLWDSEFSTETFSNDEVQKLIAYAKYLIFQRGGGGKE